MSVLNARRFGSWSLSGTHWHPRYGSREFDDGQDREGVGILVAVIVGNGDDCSGNALGRQGNLDREGGGVASGDDCGGWLVAGNSFRLTSPILTRGEPSRIRYSEKSAGLSTVKVWLKVCPLPLILIFLLRPELE